MLQSYAAFCTWILQNMLHRNIFLVKTSDHNFQIITITALLHRFLHFVRSFFCVADVLIFVRGFIQKAFQIFDQMCVRYVSGLKL